MILFYSQSSAGLRYRIGDNGGDDAMKGLILSEEEAKNVVQFPLLSISPNGELVFDFSSLEEERKQALDALKKTQFEFIKEEANRIRKLFTGGATPEELAGWSIKAQIARKFIVGEADEFEKSALILESKIRGKGETAEDLAKLQLLKASKLLNANYAIDGFLKYSNDIIEKCTTEEEIQKALELLGKEKDKLFLQFL